MSTNFPTTLDDGTTLPNPSGANTLNSPDHASIHANGNDAIKAVEGKVGTGSSTPANNTFLIGNGSGTSAWSSLTSAQLASRISDETGSGAAVFANTPTLVTPKADTINEATAANGVTIDGLNIKDGALNTNNSVVTSNVTDSAVTTAKIATDAVTDDKLDYPRWWQEIGRTTLGSAGDTISVASLPARKYLKIIFSALPSGQISPYLRFNNDSAGNYSFRYDYNNGTASTANSQSGVSLDAGSGAFVTVGQALVLNISNQEKVIEGIGSNQGTAGAASAPNRIETVGKWSNTASQVTRVDLVNVGSGDFAIGSEVIVLGHD